VTDLDTADRSFAYFDQTATALYGCISELSTVIARLSECANHAAVIREHRRSRYHALLTAQAKALSDLLGEFADAHRASAVYFGRECDRLIDAEKTSPMVAVARQPRGVRIGRARPVEKS